MWPGGEKQGKQAERERDAEVAESIYYCIKESNPLIPLPAGHCESSERDTDSQRHSHHQQERKEQSQKGGKLKKHCHPDERCAK